MNQKDKSPIILKDMGSFNFSGTVLTGEDGDTFHCNHGYTQYFIPENARNYPLVFWHGMGQCGRCWESTPDGRDGFWQIFTRKQYATFIIDQTQRGRAGRTSNIAPDTVDRPFLTQEAFSWAGVFRNATWNPPEPAVFHEGCAAALTPDAIDQFLRWQLPDTGQEPNTPEQNYYMAGMMKDLLEQTGPSILFTHSHSGKYGWATGTMAPEYLKGIVAFEPAHFLFPENFTIEPIYSPCGELIYQNTNSFNIPMEEFRNLTKYPILILWGDFIPEEPTDVYGNEVWRIGRIRSELFAKLINDNGGNAKVVRLPQVGITGNTHNGIADRNNDQIADLIDQWIQEQGLGGSEHPYPGPARKLLTEYNIPVKK